MSRDVAREVERTERRVRARRVAHQAPDVAANLERMTAADHRQVVHDLVRLAQIDPFPTRAVAERVESLDVDLREADLQLVRRPAVRSADVHAVNAQVILN
jgi:hypothetical protein